MIISVMIRYFFGMITSLLLGVLFMNVMERRYPLWRVLFLEIIGISAVVLPKSYAMVQTGQMPVGVMNFLGMMVYIFLMFLCFQGSIWKKILTMVVGIGLQGLTEIITITSFMYMGLTTAEKLSEDMGYAAMATVETIIYTIFLYLYGMATKRFSRKNDKIQWGIILVPVSIAISIIPYIASGVNQDIKISRFGIFCCAVILVAVMGLPVALQEINRREEKQEELLELEREYRIGRRHVEQLEQNAQAVRKLEHDFNNQMMVVMGMVKEGRTREAEAMLGEIEDLFS